jgi:hypothetical protein
MKRSFTFLLLLAAMTLLTTSYSSGPFFGGTGNRTGSAGSNAGCEGPICHAAAGTTTSLSITLLRNGTSVTSYIPGQQYRVRLALPVSGTQLRNFGFQASIVRAANGVTQAGFLTDGGRSDLSVHQDVLVQLVEHNRYLPGTRTGSSYNDTISFGWQAPAAGFGSVRVYAALAAVDSNGTAFGDQTRVAFQDFREELNTSGTGSISPENQLRLAPNPVPAGGTARLSGLRPGVPTVSAIVDMRGTMLLRNALAPAADGTAIVPVQSLRAGQYVLVVVQEQRIRSLPILIK